MEGKKEGEKDFEEERERGLAGKDGGSRRE